MTLQIDATHGNVHAFKWIVSEGLILREEMRAM